MEQRLLCQESSTETANTAPQDLPARFNNMEEARQRQVVDLLGRLFERENTASPSRDQYAQMGEILTLLGYLQQERTSNTTAILNALSSMSIDMNTRYTNPLALFQVIQERLGVSKAKIIETRTEQHGIERKQALKKLLPHQASPVLQQKINALTPEQIRRILRPLYWAVYTEEESTGLKKGGYQKNKQAQSIQEALSAMGYYKGNPDGIYGPRTRLAVKKLQLDLNETDDGAFGNKTFLSLRNLLEATLAEKKMPFRQAQEKSRQVPEAAREQSKPAASPAQVEIPTPAVSPEEKTPAPLPETAIPEAQPDVDTPDATAVPATKSEVLSEERVRERIADPHTPEEDRRTLHDWLVQKELSRTHADYLQQMAVHGPEVPQDIANLKASYHLDPRNYPDNTEYMAHDESGNATRLFVNFHGEPYFSITRDPFAAQFGLRLMGKLGDPNQLFMYHISRREMVPVVPAASSDQKDLYAEKGGKERIFHQSGIEALPNVHGEYEFFTGPPELQSTKFLKRTAKNGKVAIVKGERYPEGENAKK